jgi:hypothetical protein
MRLTVIFCVILGVLGLCGTASAAVVTVPASVDTYVRADQPTSSFGTQTLLQIDGVPDRRTLLRFDVPASPAGISAVTLRVYVDFSTGQGYDVRASSCSFTDTTTYNTAPAAGALLGSRTSDPLGNNDFVLPVDSVPAAGGQVCFQATKTGDFWGNLRSREHSGGLYAPKLIVTQHDATQCSDGVDNADPEDTLVDMADPGCVDQADNDETDPLAPPSATGHTATPNPALTTDTIQFAIQGASCPDTPCVYRWTATEVTVGTPRTDTWTSSTANSTRQLPAGRWNIRPTITDEQGRVADRIPPDPLTITVNAAPTPPADLFVASNGSSTSNCTQAAPCTVARANAIVAAGQVVSVACGEYGPATFSRGGTSSAWVVWQPASRRCAQFSASSEFSTGSSIRMSAQYVEVRSFRARWGRVSVAITASNTKFIDNEVHHVWNTSPHSSGAAAVDAFTSNYVPMSNVTIDRNWVHHVGRTPVGQAQTTQGIYIASPCPGCPVTNNVIHDVEDFGIHGYHEACSWHVVNNTSARNGRGILVGPQSVRRNNISAFNKGNGWQISSATRCSSGGVQTSNNTSWGNGNNNLTTGIESHNPLFVNDAGRDYHLQTGSPSIDTGTSLNAPPLDHDGVARPINAFDRGAYER